MPLTRRQKIAFKMMANATKDADTVCERALKLPMWLIGPTLHLCRLITRLRIKIAEFLL